MSQDHDHDRYQQRKRARAIWRNNRSAWQPLVCEIVQWAEQHPLTRRGTTALARRILAAAGPRSA